MTDKNTNTQSGGIGFVGMLTILFIGLKLTGYITWSWLWVLSPLWISFSIVMGVILLMLIFYLVVYLIDSRR